MLKKILLLILFVGISLSVIACGESSSTAITSTNLISTTTTDERPILIDEAYENLITNLPTEFSLDIILPDIPNEDFLVEYFVDNNKLVDNTLNYVAQGFDEIIDVEIRITYKSYTKEYTFEILMLRDEDLYNQELTNQRFSEIIEEVRTFIPEVLVSDFTIPEIDIPGAEILISTSDATIYNNRLIFTFPDYDEEVNLSIQIEYNRETRNYQLPVIFSNFSNLLKIPEIYILTDESAPIETKEDYVYGYLDMFSYDQYNNSILELGGIRMRIKLRGNSTLVMPKKPYKIKFDEKQNMLSEYQEKEWVLLANFADQTLVRNAVAYQMANDLDMAFSPMVRFVDLYINNVYQGNYLLSDQIEVSTNRVNVEEKSPNMDTGYLIEFDKRLYDEGLEVTEENFFLIEGIPFVIKSPDIEDDHYNNDQYLFIESYMRTVYDTLRDKEDYSLYIDEASFIDWFIVSEVMKNVDSGYSSVYFHKDAGGLLKMGPVWDFDLSSGNYGHLQEDLRGPIGWYTPRPDKNVFFMYLLEYEGFKTALKQRWNEVYETVILQALENVYLFADSIARSRSMNFDMWDIIGKYEDWFISPEILALDTYEEQLFFLYDFLDTRMTWLNQEINAF
ncbi:MAG: hypothetical protein CVV60_04110 [Tenericutes bacterium HGW-Tenericutes-5]|nr:MAG: hypothetical protein CVV60_04110 [Tenericutes bacterium HGW-Tenericutes-5]